jgi:hypothetical protein
MASETSKEVEDIEPPQTKEADNPSADAPESEPVPPPEEGKNEDQPDVPVPSADVEPQDEPVVEPEREGEVQQENEPEGEQEQLREDPREGPPEGSPDERKADEEADQESGRVLSEDKRAAIPGFELLKDEGKSEHMRFDHSSKVRLQGLETGKAPRSVATGGSSPKSPKLGIKRSPLRKRVDEHTGYEGLNEIG